MIPENGVGLIGGGSFVGERLRLVLEADGYETVVFSRQGRKGTISLQTASRQPVGSLTSWFCLAPIWTLPEHFQLLEKHGAKRLVALSSTSRFTKKLSGCPSDRALATRLIEGERQAREWAQSWNCSLIILQPTLIYGLGQDKNVVEIARVIRRFGFFPLFGRGEGLRRPVHVDDVADACYMALRVSAGKMCATYILSGQEVLTYRSMVERIFAGLGRKPRFVHCPLPVFSLAVRLAGLFPSCRGLTTEMAVRMNKDQDFDHSAAGVDLGFHPRSFHPQYSDLII